MLIGDDGNDTLVRSTTGSPATLNGGDGNDSITTPVGDDVVINGEQVTKPDGTSPLPPPPVVPPLIDPDQPTPPDDVGIDIRRIPGNGCLISNKFQAATLSNWRSQPNGHQPTTCPLSVSPNGRRG